MHVDKHLPFEISVARDCWSTRKCLQISLFTQATNVLMPPQCCISLPWQTPFQKPMCVWIPCPCTNPHGNLHVENFHLRYHQKCVFHIQCCHCQIVNRSANVSSIRTQANEGVGKKLFSSVLPVLNSLATIRHLRIHW